MMFRVLLIAAFAAAVPAAADPIHETVSPLLRQPIPNIPGKIFTSVIVTFPPGAKADPHRHGEAFVYAYVLSGEVRSQLDDQPAKVYRTGESWFEPPGARHKVTENVSKAELAKLLVVFISNAGDPLKIPDRP